MKTMVPVVVLGIVLRLLIPCALLCILQYVLAKLESPWPGRVLPILSGATSLPVFLLFVFNIAAVEGSQWALLTAFGYLLVMNIPTVLFILVYRVTRRRQIEKKNMDKMNIQDLE